MRAHLIVAATLVALAALVTLAQEASAAEPMLTPGQVLQKALATKQTALYACGVRWTGASQKAMARFSLDFTGKVKGLRIEGLPEGSPAQQCLLKELSTLKLPSRLAFIVVEFALPLPIALVETSSSAAR
jgi:hypothetical protein